MKAFKPSFAFFIFFLVISTALCQDQVDSPIYKEILDFGQTNLLHNSTLTSDAKVVCEAIESSSEELFQKRVFPSKEKARSANVNLFTKAWLGFREKYQTGNMPQAAFAEFSREFTWVSVISSPTGALIKFNQEKKGETNLEFLGIEKGQYTYELSLENFHSATGTITINGPSRIEKTLLKK